MYPFRSLYTRWFACQNIKNERIVMPLIWRVWRQNYIKLNTISQTYSTATSARWKGNYFTTFSKYFTHSVYGVRSLNESSSLVMLIWKIQSILLAVFLFNANFTQIKSLCQPEILSSFQNRLLILAAFHLIRLLLRDLVSGNGIFIDLI